MYILVKQKKSESCLTLLKVKTQHGQTGKMSFP